MMNLKFKRTLYGHTLEMARLFRVWSDIKDAPRLSREYEYDAGVGGLISLIELGARQNLEWDYVQNNINPCTLDIPKSAVVCFSGGKDSTATAMKMRDMGYNVSLYFLKGINKSYPNELERATAIADILGMPLKVDECKQTGSTTFRDNPIKNQLIASMALDWAVENGIANQIAFGDFLTDNTGNSSFNECWSDCIEMWQEHEQFVRRYVTNYKVHILFNTYIETLDTVAKDKRLLENVQGCVLPHRFMAVVKSNNEKKYGVSLLPNHCGSCWKCCVEYIRLADTGVVEYNEKFYKHCLDFLRGKMNELRHSVAGDHASIADTYNAFLYGDYEKDSIYFDKTQDYGK